MANIYNDKFCSACGNGLIQTAIVCPRCGSSTNLLSVGTGQTYVKSKTVAVVLAVFLGPWGWLYTFAKNKAKFFISVPSLLATLYLQAAVISTTLNDVLRGQDGDPRIALFANVIYFFVGFPFWLWAVIDNARKPREYFERYVR